jgi:peptide/nickel transport system permease protein
VLEYLTRRVALLVPTLVGVSLIIFGLVRLLPGNVLDAQLAGDQAASPEARAELEQALGLDQPLPTQYFDWVGGVLTGDPGESLRNGRPVADIILDALPITLELAVLGMAFALLIGVPLGLVAAARRGRGADYGGRVLGLVGISMPSFWLATLILLLTSTAFGWVPPIQYISPLSDPLGNLSQFVLPSLAVSVYPMALVMRLTRAQMLEVLRQDYIRTARAKGVSDARVLLRHGLRNALIPVVTVAGFELGHLLGGAAIIETIFGLPGLGNTLLQAIFNRDYPVVQTATLLLAAMFVVLNLVVDFLYSVIDPRIQRT